MESIISIYLYKHSPKAFTISKLSAGINRCLATVTPIRIYEKPISNALNAPNTLLNIKKTVAFGQEPEYSIPDTKEFNEEDLKNKFQDKINFLEEIGLFLYTTMSKTSVGIQLPVFQKQISKLTDIDIERDDLNVLLRETFRKHILYNSSLLTFKLIDKANPIIIQLKLNEIIRNGLETGLSQEELIISNRLVSENEIKKITNGGEVFLKFKEKNAELKHPQDKNVVTKAIEIELINEHLIKLTIEKYHNANREWHLTVINRLIDFKERKKLILNFIEKKENAKEFLQVWFLNNYSSFQKFRNSLGNELFLDIYKYVESNKAETNKLIIDADDELPQTKVIFEDNVKVSPNKNEYPTLSELLPKSLFFSHIPSKDFFKNNIRNYEIRLEQAAVNLNYNVKEIKKAILCVKNNIEDDIDWELIYLLLKDGIEKQDEILTKAGEMLKTFAENPFKHFLSLLEATQENLNFDDTPRFNEIIIEACRDNIVTEAEKELIFEKATEFGGVNLDKVELYLKNEFKNYPSFIVLIDEICLDGVITNKELKFIEEKARTYRIPEAVLGKLISSGLLRIKILNDLKNNNNFQEIVIFYLLSKAFKMDETFSFRFNSYIFDLNEIGTNYSDSMLIQKKLFSEALVAHLNHLMGFNVLNSDSQLTELLGFGKFSINDFDFSTRKLPKKELFENFNSDNDNKKKNLTLLSDETILINNSIYNIIRKNMPIHPLFFYQYNSLKMQNEVVINIGHPYYKQESDFLIKQVACSFIHTKNTMTSREAEIFINRFHQNLNLIQ